MSKYNLNEGNESLKKILLLMKYDNQKTLTENIDSIEKNNSLVESSVDEQASEMASSALEYGAAGAAIGAAMGATAIGATIGTALFPGVGTVAGLAIGGLIGLLNGSGTSYNKIKESIKEYCTPKNTGKSAMSKQELNPIADAIFDAVDGMGTDEDGIKAALQELGVFPDFCELSKVYRRRHGETLIDSLDGDIDGESQWKKYVWLPILDLIDNTPVEEVKDEDGAVVPTPEDGGEGTKKKSKYKSCKGTYKMYCFNKEVIGKVQKALGIKDDGAYGPITQAALEKAGYKNGFTDADVSKIVKGGGSEDDSPNVVIKKDSEKIVGDDETIIPEPLDNQDTVAGTIDAMNSEF
ncbi:hypothetical protein N9895_01425 [Gammaproteobacteria bacterium]|nr:hypothetical protein [bacterium]MDB4277681.1 hypothetical protein [Gammaproteobacteria bacterium]